MMCGCVLYSASATRNLEQRGQHVPPPSSPPQVSTGGGAPSLLLEDNSWWRMKEE